MSHLITHKLNLNGENGHPELESFSNSQNGETQEVDSVDTVQSSALLVLEEMSSGCSKEKEGCSKNLKGEQLSTNSILKPNFDIRGRLINPKLKIDLNTVGKDDKNPVDGPDQSVEACRRSKFCKEFEEAMLQYGIDVITGGVSSNINRFAEIFLQRQPSGSSIVIKMSINKSTNYYLFQKDQRGEILRSNIDIDGENCLVLINASDQDARRMTLEEFADSLLPNYFHPLMDIAGAKNLISSQVSKSFILVKQVKSTELVVFSGGWSLPLRRDTLNWDKEQMKYVDQTKTQYDNLEGYFNMMGLLGYKGIRRSDVVKKKVYE